MRPKFVLSVLLVAFGVMALLGLLRPRSKVPAVAGGGALKNTPAPAARLEAGVFQPVVEHPALPPVAHVAPTNHAEQVSERVAELQALAMNDGTNSLEVIFSELSNPDPQIRRAALEAVVQFGDRSAIPRLQGIAEQTENEVERADLLAAVEFLNLPELTDYHPAQAGKRKAAVLMDTNRPGRNPFRRPPARPTQSAL